MTANIIITVEPKNIVDVVKIYANVLNMQNIDDIIIVIRI